MLKEKFKPSHHHGIPAIANFLSESFFQDDIQNLPINIQEIFNLFLETEQTNTRKIRIKVLRCLKTTRNINNCLKPSSKKTSRKSL